MVAQNLIDQNKPNIHRLDWKAGPAQGKHPCGIPGPAIAGDTMSATASGDTRTLDDFRSDTRAWLRSQLPGRDAPAGQERRRCLLGRQALPVSERRAAPVDAAHGRTRLDGADLAARIRRRRPEPCRGRGAARGDGGAEVPAAAAELRHLDAGAGAAQVRQRAAEARATWVRSRAARSAGARATRSRTPAPTWRRWRRAPRSTAITSSSTARRSGPPTPTRPTGSSAWCAPTPRRSTTASASCCST